MAVIPSVSDPRLNTVECVIPGHGKAPQFSGVKQLLHGVCWSLLVISLAMSTLSSQLITVKLRSWGDEEDHRSKTAATMFLSLLLFLGGLAYNLYICISATKVGNKQEISYVWVFFGSILFVLFRRLFWCMFVYEWKCFSERNLTGGHGEMTTKNLFSGVVLYPAVFIVFHHLLWIFLGMITEPFWGFTVLVAVIALCAVLFFSLSELHRVFPENFLSCENWKEKFIFFMSLFLILAVLSAFVLFVVVLFMVAQVFLSESLISTLIQNTLTFVVTVWFGYMNILKESNKGVEEEGKKRPAREEELPLEVR